MTPVERESIVRGRQVLCGVDAAGRLIAIENGAVLQRDGRIEAIGPYEDLAARYPSIPTIGTADHVVMPGLVDTHHHVGLTPVQLGTPDLPLELWLTAQLGARKPDAYLDTLYSAFELIGSGVTAVQHLDIMQPAPVSAWPERAHKVISAYDDIGMRVSYAVCVRDQNRLVYGDDDAFIATLPPDLARETDTFLRQTHFRLEDFESDFLLPMIKAYAGRSRVRIWLAPINLERCSDRLLGLCRQWSERYGIGIHLHLSETAYQKIYAERRWGHTATRHLRDLGFLGPHLTLGHAVWASEDDMESLAASGACVCHNASSNLRLRSGISPIGEFIARGIPVAIGIDEAGLNDDRDMLQEMRVVKHLHCTPGLDAQTLSTVEIFKMATENGARAIGFGDEIGSLAVGKRADLLLLDYARISSPYLDPAMPVLDAIVYRAKATDVAMVLVDGKVVFGAGRFSRVDRNSVATLIARDLSAPIQPDAAAVRDLAQALSPHLKAFYADWPMPEGKPFYVLNSRH